MSADDPALNAEGVALLPYLRDLESLLPGAAFEEVGDRRELVIYTGLTTATYDANKDEWTDTPDGRLVPYPEELD